MTDPYPNSHPVPSVIERPLPNAVTYDLHTPGQVTITLPVGSSWTSGLHWHETHTEYLRVVRGRIRVRLGPAELTVDAGEPEVRVGRHEWHEWRRADDDDGGVVTVVERTDPADLDKAVFFWNLNGVILQAPAMARDPASWVARLPARVRGPALDLWVALSLFVVFSRLDNVPVFLDVACAASALGLRLREGSAPQRLAAGVDFMASHVILVVASRVGSLLGIEAVRREFTPAHVYEAWCSSHGVEEPKTK